MFKKNYRERKTNRVQWCDYGEGIYMITICTQKRKEYFGKIKNGIMCLSTMGIIAQKCWDELPKHFPEIKIDAFIVMPNHVHGIIGIYDLAPVGTRHALSLPAYVANVT